MDDDGKRMIVGLGNPGSKYDKTRHNIGFECINRLKARWGMGIPTSKFQGEWVRGEVGGSDVLLVWPLTYMNASGRCVQPAAGFYKITPDRIMVICDDMALPVGKLRIRKSGSAGGQKGLMDILRALGTQDVPRLRIGIGACPEKWDAADYVLGRFRADEVPVIEQAMDRACAALEDWVAKGIDYVMNQYNRNEEQS